MNYYCENAEITCDDCDPIPNCKVTNDNDYYQYEDKENFTK